jgi:hypothetical protein
VLLGLRCAPKEESGLSAAEAVYKTSLVLPSQLKPASGQPRGLPPPSLSPSTSPSSPSSPSPPSARTYAEVVAGPVQQLWKADYVYVRRGNVGGPFQPPYSGPYVVLGRYEKVFEIQVGPRVERVSVDRLKVHKGAAPVTPAMPSPRGRPPGSGGMGSSPPTAASLEGGHVAAGV